MRKHVRWAGWTGSGRPPPRWWCGCAPPPPMWPTWAWGVGLVRGVRQVLAGLTAVVVAYVWIAQWQGSGWSLARHSILLPVLVAGVGVACLFLSARHQQRQAWVGSAV